MALTKISTGGVKDDAASQAKIADEAVDEARLQISNAGSNGQFLQKQSGDTGGLTWATVDTDLSSDTTPQLGGDLDTNAKNIKLGDSAASPTAGFTNIDDRITFGTGDGTYPDLSIWSDGSYGHIQFAPAGYLHIGNTTTTNSIINVHPNNINLNKLVNVQDSDIDIRKSGASKVLWDDSDTAIEFANDVKLTFGGSNGTSGQVLTSKGASAAPEWAAVPPGGNSVDLVADGAIAAGKPVIIKSNGKAEQVKLTPTARTTPLFDGSGNTGSGTHGPQWGSNSNNVASCWGRTYKTAFVIARRDSSPKPLKGALIKVNSSDGGSPTIGVDDVNLFASNQNWFYNDTAYDITNNKYGIIGKRDADNRICFSFVSTTSDSNLSTSNGQWDISGASGADNERRPRIVFIGSGRFALIYCKSTDNEMFCKIASWNSSNNNYDFGSEVSIQTEVKDPSACWHEASGKIIVFWGNYSGSALSNPSQGNDSGAMNVLTVSGSGTSASVSVATRVPLPDRDSCYRQSSIITDDNTDKIVAIGSNVNGGQFYSWVCSLSGTTLSIGNAVQVESADVSTAWQHRYEVVYHDGIQKVLAWYGGTNSNNFYVKQGTVSSSSNTITWANRTQWSSGNGMVWNSPVVAYGDDKGSVITSFTHSNAGDPGRSRQFQFLEQVKNITTSSSNSVLNYTNILGFAEDAISDGNTGTIKLPGNVVGNQSGLTAGTFYYHKPDGTLATSGDSEIYNAKAGTAISSTKLLIKDPNP